MEKNSGEVYADLRNRKHDDDLQNKANITLPSRTVAYKISLFVVCSVSEAEKFVAIF